MQNRETFQGKQQNIYKSWMEIIIHLHGAHLNNKEQSELSKGHPIALYEIFTYLDQSEPISTNQGKFGPNGTNSNKYEHICITWKHTL